MDGLTISSSEALLQTGKTASEIRDARLNVDNSITSQSEESGPSFSNTLNDAINKVNDLQKDADVKMEALATGKAKNIPEVMIATEKADIAFKLMMQVRNKIIDAYQEIMKMQV